MCLALLNEQSNQINMTKKKENLEVLNGFIIVRPLEIKPKKDLGLIDKEGKKAASMDNYNEHPIQAEVVLACKYYLNNGIEYASNIKEGDILLLRDMSREMQNPSPPVVIANGEQLIYIRYSDIIAVKR